MEPSFTIGGTVNWCSHYGNQHRDSSKNLIMELPYDPQPGDESQGQQS